ncbi:MAG: ParA family protein [Planctomycetota bacterium]
MRTIAVLNQKGGVGKTTTVANTAAALAMLGHKVVVVDLDPQAHLTIHLGIDSKASSPGAYEVLTKSVDIAQALVQVRPNLWLLGGNIDLVGVETELVSVVGREIILREALEAIEDDYDYVIIDCPPSLGLLTLNALAAVKETFIPVQPHFLALQGFGTLLETITLVTRRINPELKVTGILLCMFDKRALLPSEVKADIEQFLANARDADCPWSDARIIPVHVRRNIKLAEAPSYGKTIFEYEPKCNGSADYRTVAEYIHSQTAANSEPEPELEPADIAKEESVGDVVEQA